jgi:hypothetical protein
MGTGLIGREAFLLLNASAKDSALPGVSGYAFSTAIAISQSTEADYAWLTVDSRARLVLFVELRVSAGKRYIAPVDEHVLYLSPYLERVAIGHYQVSDFALLN